MIRAGGTPTQLAEGIGRDAVGLLFVAEMYGVQLDQLPALLGVSARRASAIVAQWAERGEADSGRLSPGARWVWLTGAGLAACGRPYAASVPALSRLAHLRAVTAARLALEGVPAYAEAAAHWRSERHLRARLGGRLGQREHLPDAEVHWPGPAGPADGEPNGWRGPAWAGECWAIEVELTPKTLARTAAIMRELLTRTSDYGGPAAVARVRDAPPRHARLVYLCSPAATGVVGRARGALGADGARIEIRSLPAGAQLPAPARRPASP